MNMMIHQPLSRALPLVFTAVLVGCGGGGGSGDPEAPKLVSTILSGVVSNGVLKGSKVCAYAISASSKGAALGSCVEGDESGLYSIDIGGYSGPLLVEATGGSYTDAATGINVLLAVPLRSLLPVASAGEPARAVVTPLTELAFRAATSTTAGLSTTGIQSAIDSVQSNFGLADIVGSAPADTLNPSSTATGAQKSYALAIATISQVISQQPSGTSLATVLQALQSCIASPATACGAGDKNIGEILNVAKTDYQNTHSDFADVALPVASFGAGMTEAKSPSIGFSVPVLTFPEQENFTTSRAQTVTLTNTGNTGILLYREYSIPLFGRWDIVSDTCIYAPRIFTAGATCTIGIAFSPFGQDTKRAAYSLQLEAAKMNLGNFPEPIRPDGYEGFFSVRGDSVTNPQIPVPKLSVALNGTGVYPPAAPPVKPDVPTVEQFSGTYTVTALETSLTFIVAKDGRITSCSSGLNISCSGQVKVSGEFNISGNDGQAPVDTSATLVGTIDSSGKVTGKVTGSSVTDGPFAGDFIGNRISGGTSPKEAAYSLAGTWVGRWYWSGYSPNNPTCLYTDRGEMKMTLAHDKPILLGQTVVGLVRGSLVYADGVQDRRIPSCELVSTGRVTGGAITADAGGVEETTGAFYFTKLELGSSSFVFKGAMQWNGDELSGRIGRSGSPGGGDGTLVLFRQ